MCIRDSLEQLYEVIMEIDLENDDTKIMNDLLFNYFIWGAAHHNQRQFLVEMMYQSSVLNYKIDL